MRVKISLIRLPQEQLWGKRKRKKNYDEQIPVNKDSESSKPSRRLKYLDCIQCGGRPFHLVFFSLPFFSFLSPGPTFVELITKKAFLFAKWMNPVLFLCIIGDLNLRN